MEILNIYVLLFYDLFNSNLTSLEMDVVYNSFHSFFRI